MHILNLEEFCSLDAYPASILHTPFYATRSFAITYILMFHSVARYTHWYICMHCITFVLTSVLVAVPTYMSVFESPPCHSIRMDREQTLTLGPQISEKMPWMTCYVGFVCKVMIQNTWNKRLKETDYNDELIHLYMPWKIQLAGELVSTLFLMYIHTTQVLQ